MSFRDYLLHGWKLCSIPPGTKGPRAPRWNCEDQAIVAPEIGPQMAGAGLCHAWSGTCAIDVDDYTVAREWLQQQGIDLDALLLAPTSVQISSGRENRAKLLYALSKPLASVKVAHYQRISPKTGKMQTFHALELRCATADGLTVQDVLPETIHPETGRPYVWKYGDELFGHWANLPEIPAALLKLWTEQLTPERAPSGPMAAVGAEYAELRELLTSFDPDATYDEWIRVGLAIHHETAGTGFALWDEWSARGSKYKGADDLRSHWASFRADAANPITLGSLRSGVVAKPGDFPLDEPAESPARTGPLDNRPDAIMQRVVGDHVVYVRDVDLYFDLDGRKLFPSKDALRNNFMPLIPVIKFEDKARKLDPVTWLMNSSARRDADVLAVGMHPGKGAIFTEGGQRFANGYRPPAPIESLRPKPAELEAFEFIWNRMQDEVFKRWLKKFYAHALKYPGVKIRSAPLLISETTGTGKSLLMSMIPTLLFGRVAQMTESQLRTQFNGELLNAWWVTFEEVYSGNTKAERRFVTEKVKTWLTNDDLAINAKNLTAFTMKNRLQFTASSNHLDALQLEDEEERRWGVCHVAEQHYTEQERQDAVIGFLLTPRAPGVLKYIFEQESLTGFQKDGRPPITHAKKAMVVSGIGAWESSLIECMLNNEPPFDKDVFKLKDVHEHLIGRGPLSLHALGAILRRKPFNCALLQNFSKSRLWAWRNVKQWQQHTEGQRIRYMESGVRPPDDVWSDEPPVALAEMGADGVPTRDDCADLL